MTHTHSTKKTRNFSIKDDVFGSLSGLITVAIVLVAISFFVGGWMLFAQSTTEYTSTPATTHGYSQLMVGTDRSGSSVACFKGDLFCPEDAVPYEEYFANLKQDLPLDIGELSNNHVG